LIEQRLHRSGFPLAVLGSGPRTVIVIGYEPNPASVHALAGDLASGVTFGADARAGVAAAVAQSDPRGFNALFSGTIPGGLPGAPEAYVFSGLLIQPDRITSGGEPVSVQPIALLPDRSLEGTVGPEAGWMTSLASSPSGASEGPPQGPVVDLMFVAVPVPLELTTTASILAPEAELGVLQPTLTGVAPDPERPGDLIVGSEAVDVMIEGPLGSRIWWERGGAYRETSISADGTARIRLLEPASSDASEGSTISHSVTLVTPAGHAYHGSWRIRVYRQPPDLGMDEEVPLIDFAPAVTGRTLPGSTITVNGQSGEVEADGSFSEPVDSYANGRGSR
jgi:hypothetical protein